MSKPDKNFAEGPMGLAESGLLKRLAEMARFSRYDANEAADQAKAAVVGASQYMETKSPEADILIVAAVPFRNPDGTHGNAMAQEIRAGRHFGLSMRDDVLPLQGRFFCQPGWRGFGQRLKLCWKILFGKNPGGYERHK